MQQRRARRAFTAEDEARVVGPCRQGDRSVAEIARELDPTESLVRWREQAEVDAGRKPSVTSREHEELVRLRKGNRVRREERTS